MSQYLRSWRKSSATRSKPGVIRSNILGQSSIRRSGISKICSWFSRRMAVLRKPSRSFSWHDQAVESGCVLCQFLQLSLIEPPRSLIAIDQRFSGEEILHDEES